MTLQEAVKTALGTYSSVRKTYYEAVFVAVYDYLDGTNAITEYKRAIKLAMVNAFLPAAEIGYQDGGGSLPMDDATLSWLADMQAAEIGYIDALFVTLRDMRGGEDVEKVNVALSRAEGYAQTLDMIYNRAKLAGAGNLMLTFAGDDGKESCDDCKRYKNKRRRAKWWVQNDAIPPNRNFECRGYNCRHVLVDDNGNVWTL